MDIFFQDPSEIPLPPDEVRIRALRADLWPDGRRVTVTFEVDPFQKRPNASITITDPEGREAASTSIIETMIRRMEFTMHLRGELPAGEYLLSATLFYSEVADPEESEAETNLPAQMKVVDHAESKFSRVAEE